jgi:hypothetical protein
LILLLRIYIFYISYELCFWPPSHLSSIQQSLLIWMISVLLHMYQIWSNCSLAFIDSVGIWSSKQDMNWVNTTSKWSPEQKCTSLSCIASLSTTAVTGCTDRQTFELRVTVNKRPVYCR